ncbi:hypothetical protein [Stenotrophomonas sp. NPDC077659]|uniref:hypothetical protein n=1 Tax=Stenotrophomonas sp. NPDC077659 TaxID=3390694 RepID=UPI003D03DF14
MLVGLNNSPVANAALQRLREPVDYRAPSCLDGLTPNPGNNETPLTDAQIRALLDHPGTRDGGQFRLKAGRVTSYASRSCVKNFIFWGWAIREGERSAYRSTMQHVRNLVTAAGGLDNAKSLLDQYPARM